MIPLWMILSVPFGLLLFSLIFITLNRYISYKERVALVQLGFTLDDLHRDAAAKRGSRGVLWGGVITAMSGLALLLGLSTLGLGAWLLGGLLPLFVGLGMILLYFVASTPAADHARAEAGPPPWAADVTDDLAAEVAGASPVEAPGLDDRSGPDVPSGPDGTSA